MPVKVCWFGVPHSIVPLPSQVTALQTLFPSSELTINSEPCKDADDIAMQYELLGGDVLVVVASLTILSFLLRKGYRPICPRMERLKVGDPRMERMIGDIPYRFNRFREAVKVNIEYAEVDPQELLARSKKEKTA